jgi:glycosyltransferase involved in cell wall biosynthesis
VAIKDPIYGEDKIHVYRSAELFVLSSLNENFAITVAEALAAETPVISTQAAPWSGLETNKCGWWVGNSVDCIASALRKAMSTPANEREAMGKRGRLWMSRDFAWPRVAADMLDVYKWLHTGAQLPSTVRSD